jgi:hypothetical protein
MSEALRRFAAVAAVVVGGASTALTALAFTWGPPTTPVRALRGAARACRLAANPYYTFPLDPARATGASGIVKVSFSDSPFGVAMTPDGHYTYSLDITTSGLPKLDAGTYVVWATPPNLNPILRLGPLGSDGRLLAQVDLNKFILIVSAETSAKTARWSDPIMLRGISRSSLMHSFMGHGPFEGPC